MITRYREIRLRVKRRNPRQPRAHDAAPMGKLYRRVTDWVSAARRAAATMPW